MIKLFTYISLFCLAGLFTGCSQVLQTVDLNINSEDHSKQEVSGAREVLRTAIPSCPQPVHRHNAGMLRRESREERQRATAKTDTDYPVTCK